MNIYQKKVLIAEDKVLIAEHLRDILLSSGYNVVGMFHNKTETIKGLKSLLPDIALLDIKMETKYAGIEIGEFIAQDLDIPYIYITAHSEKITLDKALKTKPNGYILKPFKEQEIIIAIKLALETYENKLEEVFISFKDSNANIKIPENEIIFVKADNNYVEINTVKQKYLLRLSLKAVFEKLNKEFFIRIHRSYIVNIKHVTRLQANGIFIKNETIPVSRKYLHIVKKYFT